MSKGLSPLGDWGDSDGLCVAARKRSPLSLSPKLYKLYTLYTKPARSLQNLYSNCTVLWSKPAQNRGTISLLPVKHWQNIKLYHINLGKRENTHMKRTSAIAAVTAAALALSLAACGSASPPLLPLLLQRAPPLPPRLPPPRPLLLRLPLPVTSTPTRTSRSSP